MQNSGTMKRILLCGLAGAIFGALAALVAVPFRPEGTSPWEIVLLFAFGIGGLGLWSGSRM